MPEFTRYTPRSNPPIGALDLNARAEAIEKLQNLGVAPPLRMTKTGAGYHLSIDSGMLATILGVVPGHITNCTVDRPTPHWPNDVRYDAEPQAGFAGPNPADYSNVIPRYGRPVYGREGMLHACAVGDSCFFVREFDNQGQIVWKFMVINEQIAGGDCGSEGPPPPPPPPGTGPDDGPITAPLIPLYSAGVRLPPYDGTPMGRAVGGTLGVGAGSSSPSIPGVARRMINSLMYSVGLLHRQTQEQVRMPSSFERSYDCLLKAGVLNVVSDSFDVSDCETGSISVRLTIGTVGTTVLTIQGESGSGTWTTLQNNADWDQPILVTPGTTECRNLNLKNIKRIRVKVTTASGDATTEYLVEFYSTNRRR